MRFLRRVLFLGAFLVGGILIWYVNLPTPEIPSERALRLQVPEGITFGEIIRRVGAQDGTVEGILSAADEKYDFRKIISGRDLALIYDTISGGNLKKLTYSINSEEQLIAEYKNGQWEAVRETIAYEIKEGKVSGVIETSLYQTLIDKGYDERLALALAEMFAWQVDFVADIRVGDSFEAIYEERWLDGKYVMPGYILAARFTNDGAVYKGYWFESENSEGGHYDENGEALQKQFLKAPLQYRYISSGFSYARFNPVTKKVAPHRGIDYAAPAGTPAVSIGDGTVVQAGWNGPYGISVLVRHNEMYSSRYGHFQSLAKGIRVGAKVKQGQVVGYVGSTGESTGPHLHYEIHKFGALVNPFNIEVPPGEPVKVNDKAIFYELVKKFDI
ncbi:MAG: peptidoglycan DD-metalloendopeptidase family protein [Candidatus Harrisonbacteria bacterium]|nr:peptidoglycan DD-metalloendopeptidase family protein [Candidatus Harrisonbacteria bacterium]